MNKILGILAVIFVIFAILFTVGIPEDWQDDITDPDTGETICSLKQEVTVRYVDNSTETITSGSSPILVLYRNNKQVATMIYDMYGKSDYSGADSILLNYHNLLIKAKIYYPDGGLVGSNILIDGAGMPYPFYAIETGVGWMGGSIGGGVNIVDPYFWSNVGLGTYTVEISATGSIGYALDADNFNVDFTHVPINSVITYQIELR